MSMHTVCGVSGVYIISSAFPFVTVMQAQSRPRSTWKRGYLSSAGVPQAREVTVQHTQLTVTATGSVPCTIPRVAVGSRDVIVRGHLWKRIWEPVEGREQPVSFTHLNALFGWKEVFPGRSGSLPGTSVLSITVSAS